MTIALRSLSKLGILWVSLALSWPAYGIIKGDGVEANRYSSYVSIRGVSIYPRQKGANINACGGVLVTPAAQQRTGYGDSGGPIYTQGNTPDQQMLLGVVKGGVRISSTGNQESEYIRYTQANTLTDWINETIASGCP